MPLATARVIVRATRRQQRWPEGSQACGEDTVLQASVMHQGKEDAGVRVAASWRAPVATTTKATALQDVPVERVPPVLTLVTMAMPTMMVKRSA